MTDTCYEPSNKHNRGPRWNRLTYQPKRIQSAPGEQKDAKKYNIYGDLKIKIVKRD